MVYITETLTYRCHACVESRGTPRTYQAVSIAWFVDLHSQISAMEQDIRRDQCVEDSHSSIEWKFGDLGGRELSVGVSEDGDRLVFVASKGFGKDAVVAGLLDGIDFRMRVLEVDCLGHDEVLRLFCKLIGRSDDKFALVALLTKTGLDLRGATKLGDTLEIGHSLVCWRAERGFLKWL